MVADGGQVSVKGPKGELKVAIHPSISVVSDGKSITVAPAAGAKKDSKEVKALWGLSRVLIANLMEGVTKGFEKQLELQGVGYRAELKGKDLVLSVGFSHQVPVAAPAGISFAVEKNIIKITGIDKQLVGETAARIRRIRKPEPYKGKGIRYVGEKVRRKEGKVVGTATSA